MAYNYDFNASDFCKKALHWFADEFGNLPNDDAELKLALTYYNKYAGTHKLDTYDCDFKRHDGKNLLYFARILLNNYKATKPFICCLCGKKSYGWGNNPDPLAPVYDKGNKDPRCCDHCDNTLVIPARIRAYTSKVNGGK